jgi:hypothetical protein
MVQYLTRSGIIGYTQKNMAARLHLRLYIAFKSIIAQVIQGKTGNHPHRLPLPQISKIEDDGEDEDENDSTTT